MADPESNFGDAKCSLKSGESSLRLDLSKRKLLWLWVKKMLRGGNISRKPRRLAADVCCQRKVPSNCRERMKVSRMIYGGR